MLLQERWHFVPSRWFYCNVFSKGSLRDSFEIQPEGCRINRQEKKYQEQP